MKRFFLILLGIFFNYQALAWDVTINPVNDNQMIWLKNTTAINQSNVYLAWFDLDDNKLLSYSVSKGWQNALEPAFENTVDLPTFESFPVVNIPAICPSKHRCFLAFVDVPPNTNVLDIEKWRNAAVLPLSPKAAYERLPNQTFFLTEYHLIPGDIFSGGVATTAAPNKTETTSSTTTTEKPDIFRRDGNNVLFANGAANKFQIIDVSDVKKPSLKSETTLKGTPREIYALNGFYGLMQSDNESSRLTVFSMTGINIIEPVHIGNTFTHLPVFHWILNTVAEQKFEGYFLQSRRRNDVIFSVNQSNNFYDMQLRLNANLIDSIGNVTTVDSNTLQGYDPKIAIFQDHLVISNSDAKNSVVTVFDLSSAKPLSSPKQIKVAGYIPSEFHLNVQNQQLRIVYGPSFNSKEGSTLAIYDLSTPDLSLIGKVEKIAPNEALFATRFVGDMAYVVTYERKDPLWAIDLSNPKQPTIKGELIVPGWSERMFFNDNKLFAIGFDDQLAEGETWARRVSASLFDVANSTDLKLINKITPLWGKSSYSYSQATSDERALLLDWDQQLAAFPLESWNNQSNSYLQILRFIDNKLSDAGLLALPLTPQRSLLLNRDELGILSDQVFFTANIANNDPKLLGELELARNLQWLAKSPNGLIAAAQGTTGFYRVYKFDSTNLSKPLQTWSLPHSYTSIKTDGKLAVFFNQNPLRIQILNLEKNILYPAQTSDIKLEGWNVMSFVDNGYFYAANQQYLEIQPMRGINEETTSVIQPYVSTLNRWGLEEGKITAKKSLNLAGQPIVIKGNFLISQENEYSNNPRLNLLTFDEERAKLLSSLALDCQINSTVWADDSLYVSCYKGGYYYDPPSGTYIVEQPKYTLLKITVQQNRLNISGRWNLTENARVLAATGKTVLLGNNYYYYGGVRPMTTVDSLAYYPMGSNCTVYRLETAQLTPLKKLDNCNNADQMVFLENQLFQTTGFTDIQSVSW
jgi:hypothetical protein